MWTTIREAKSHNPDFAFLSKDLFESSSRKLILTTTFICGGWLLFLAAYKAGQISVEIIPIMVLSMLTFWASYRLITVKLLAAQLMWVIGVMLTITLALYTFRQANIIFLYALIPLMVVVMIGWQAAVASGLLVGGLLVGLSISLGQDLIPPGNVTLVLFGAVIAGFVGWSAYSPFMTMLEWSAENYRRASDSLDEARNQRMELHQVQEDLLHTNNELSRLSTRLKLMTEKAEEARRIKEEFVANVSHELRTPLNMIIGYTDLIMKSPQVYSKRLPARLLADISSIQRNSQHLVDLINDVLDLSQVDAGRMALSKGWTSLQEIIDGALIAVRPLYESKSLYLRTELPEHNVMVYADSTRLREVLLNLLSNAGRITRAGGVWVRAIEDHSNVIISVTDTGPGITPIDQKRIFEPFSKLDGMLHHRTGGGGLGLSISKRFVELHDGKMWFESEVGMGTTFYFSIPTGISTDITASQPNQMRWINRYAEYIPRTRPYKAQAPRFIPRLMVVEKEGVFLRLFSRYTDSIEIVPADSIEAAAQMMKESPAQAIILNNPALDENQAVAPVFPYNTPVVSCWIPGREEAARQLGVVAYLLKPARQEDILATFDRLNKPDLSLLIVDDDPETLQLFARIISINRPGFKVVRAASGHEALEKMRARHPDVVMLNLMLPDQNGYQILREKANDPVISQIPVVVVSASDPVGLQVISSQFTVRRANGLSVQEFIECIMAVVGMLNSESHKPDPLEPEISPA